MIKGFSHPMKFAPAITISLSSLLILLVFTLVAGEPEEPKEKKTEAPKQNRIPQITQVSPEEAVEKVEPRALREDERIRQIDSRKARVGFSVEFDNLRNDWAIMTTTVAPEEEFVFRVWDGPEFGEYSVVSNNGGELTTTGEKHWTWKAPKEHGLHQLVINETTTDKTMCLNLFVQYPWDGKQSRVNGYMIGWYSHILYKGLQKYAKPTGFIEVTRENQDTWVSPHFQLKQFASPQTKDGIHVKAIADAGAPEIFPKYMLLETRLLLKLEMFIEKIKEKGIKTDGLFVHSGYRTPYYNSAIGNRTKHSRHVYGDAADVYVDFNNDRMIDDLDNNGKTDNADATVLFNIIHEVLKEPWHDEELIGGIGYYTSRSFRGPFVHIDTRGFEIHWGKEKPSWAK